MSVLTVGELKSQLDGIDDDMPVYAFDLSQEESHPVQLVDPTISDRVEINFGPTPEMKTYRVYVSLYHSFTVEAESKERAEEIATYEVCWDSHVKDCSVVIEGDEDE